MAARRKSDRSLRLAVIAALVSCSGCSMFVQNRYSVFGFDGLQTDSAETAQTWSILILASVATVSAALGAGGFWLVKRRLRRLRNESIFGPTTEGQPSGSIASEGGSPNHTLEPIGPAVMSSQEHGFTSRPGR